MYYWWPGNCWDNEITAGRIVETEAYAGVTDRASHAWGGRFTSRTSVMYQPGGYAYVYLCYGIHHLFNVVTAKKDIPHAVLIRALEPVEGLTYMAKRFETDNLKSAFTTGPGKLTRALGISVHDTGKSLLDNEIYIADDGFSIPKTDIIATARIGVDYAGADAALPYRFIIRDNPWISVKNKKVKP
jgi:DNA-3-methyladenine glycosylase